MKQPIDIKVNQDTPQMVTWLAACLAMVQTYQQQHYPSLPAKSLESEWGTRYIRICDVERNTGPSKDTQPYIRRSAWAFVDRTSGDVLKPASWRAPAKGSRGNIFSADNGMGSMGPYGPAYLR
jgi:hypothetical protein